MMMSSDVAMMSSCRTQFNAIAIEIATIGQHGCFYPFDHHDALRFE
jgi:hypothetical protein